MLKSIILASTLVLSSMAFADAPRQSLTALRESIDAVDDDLLLMLNERMYYTKQIGEYKKLENLPVHNPEREKEIVERLQRSKHEYLTDAQIRDIWVTLFLISKQAQ